MGSVRHRMAACAALVIAFHTASPSLVTAAPSNVGLGIDGAPGNIQFIGSGRFERGPRRAGYLYPSAAAAAESRVHKLERTLRNAVQSPRRGTAAGRGLGSTGLEAT